MQRGPNFVWHTDGHDKLKPFGFSVHGCIDRFSRRLLWSELGPTNTNPEVIAKYYLDAVKQLGGVPRKMRSDDGTENSTLEALHTFLRSSHNEQMLAWNVLLLADLLQIKELNPISHNL